jgi:hypothetical protein
MPMIKACSESRVFTCMLVWQIFQFSLFDRFFGSVITLFQYVIKLEEEEKFVLIYALFKLELVRGKTLMFVSSVDRCYKASLRY